MYCFNMPLDPIALYVSIILFGLGIGNTIYLIDKKIENKNINFIYSLIGKIIFIYSIIIIFCLGPLIFLNNSLLINFIIMLFIGLCVNFISTIILSGLLLRK